MIDYKNFLILESILEASPEFLDIIKSLREDPIAISLGKLINKDIKTNFNYLTIGDNNDIVGFQNDNQYQRNTSNKTPKSFIKVGRLVNQILSSNNIKFSDREIETFINKYKSFWDGKFSKTDNIFLVSGESIRYWYSYRNYNQGGGQLNSSCMRYDNCQDFLDIFVQNPEVCQLLVLIDDDRKLLGRAIFWSTKGNFSYYLDRVYTRWDSDVDRICSWFKDFVGDSKHRMFGDYDLKGTYVQLKKYKFDTYPYMDTFHYLDLDTKSLILSEDRDSSKIQYRLTSTDGSFGVDGHKFSRRFNVWIKSRDAVVCYDSIGQYYVHKDMTILDWKGNNVIEEDCVWSDRYKSWVSSINATEIDGLGVVDRYDVVDGYDDLDSKPKKILLSESIDDYLEVLNGSSYIYLKKDKCIKIYGSVRYSADNGYIAYSKENLDNYIILYSVPISKLQDRIDDEISRHSLPGRSMTIVGHEYKFGLINLFIPYGISGNKYTCLMNEVNLDLFGFDKSTEMVVISKKEYRSIYSNSYGDSCISYIQSGNFKNKKNKISEITKCIEENNSSNSIDHACRIITKYGSVLDYTNLRLLPLVKISYDYIVGHIGNYHQGSSNLKLIEDNKKYVIAYLYFRPLHAERRTNIITYLTGDSNLSSKLRDLIMGFEDNCYSYHKHYHNCTNIIFSGGGVINTEMNNIHIQYGSRDAKSFIDYWDRIYDQFLEKH